MTVENVVNKEEIKTQSWKVIKDVLEGSAIRSYVNRIYAAYPSEFITDGGGLPFLVVPKPSVVEDPVTLDNTKEYTITFTLQLAIGEESELAKRAKELSDLIEHILMDAQDTTETSKLFNFTVVDNDDDMDIVNENKVVYEILVVRYKFWGG